MSEGPSDGDLFTGDLFAVAHRQRACRQFLPNPVPDADIERILAAAVCAPSAENRQPWSFIVVLDPDARGAIADLIERAWREGAAAYERDRLEPRVFADVESGALSGFATAPVLIVVAADTTAVPTAALPSSIFPAVQNLLLAATALGYGSALTTLALVHERELRARLELPARVQPFAVVPIGRPARPLGPPRRRPVGESTHRDRWGTGW
ncbi:MAG: nitroreductase family protein [Acidimicrobiales bacterium]